jgi:hypothetical protein
MKTSSAKAKGRRCCQQVVDLILLSFPCLTIKDVTVTSSGVTGEDVKFSQHAHNLLPYVIECKNVESLNIWKSLEQAGTHAKNGEEPLLFFKRNRSKLYVALDAEYFIKLLQKSANGSTSSG